MYNTYIHTYIHTRQCAPLYLQVKTLERVHLGDADRSWHVRVVERRNERDTQTFQITTVNAGGVVVRQNTFW
jgi:hypothetical protein